MKYKSTQNNNMILLPPLSFNFTLHLHRYRSAMQSKKQKNKPKPKPENVARIKPRRYVDCVIIMIKLILFVTLLRTRRMYIVINNEGSSNFYNDLYMEIKIRRKKIFCLENEKYFLRYFETSSSF